MEDHRELQLLPTPSSKHLPTWASGSSRRTKPVAETEAFDGLSLDLQLSIRVRPIRQSSEYVLARPHGEYSEKTVGMNCIEDLKWQTSEQIRLAGLEKAYADHIKEMTRREMELAQSEFAMARRVWEKAREEVEKAERLKARAIRRIDGTGMEITCQACRRQFRS